MKAEPNRAVLSLTVNINKVLPKRKVQTTTINAMRIFDNMSFNIFLNKW